MIDQMSVRIAKAEARFDFKMVEKEKVLWQKIENHVSNMCSDTAGNIKVWANQGMKEKIK